MLKIRRAQKAAFPPESKKIDVLSPPPSPKESAPMENQCSAGSQQGNDRLTIGTKQIQAFRTEASRNFTEKTVGLVERSRPQWCQGKTRDEIKRFVGELTEVAQQHRVLAEVNIQKFIIYYIDYNFAIPLSDYRRNLLIKKGLDEDYRIKQFFLAITSGNELVQITLDSELGTLRPTHA